MYCFMCSGGHAAKVRQRKTIKKKWGFPFTLTGTFVLLPAAVLTYLLGVLRHPSGAACPDRQPPVTCVNLPWPEPETEGWLPHTVLIQYSNPVCTLRDLLLKVIIPAFNHRPKSIPLNTSCWCCDSKAKVN